MSAPGRALLEEKIRRVLVGLSCKPPYPPVFDSTVDELADLLRPSPAPERRPTREEALRVGAEALGKAVRASRKFPVLPEEVEPWVDAVAALFGGFAPEPVEVPVVEPWNIQDGRWIFHVSGTTPAGFLDCRQLAAVAARSNAWEEIKADLVELRNLKRGEIGYSLNDAILEKMNRPEMGVGPKKEGGPK